MRQKKLILCDPEEDYAQQMAAFLENDRDFPWKVEVYTDLEEVREKVSPDQAEVILLAESMAAGTMPYFPQGQLVLLNESGSICFPEVRQINKYQAAENVRRELLGIYACTEEAAAPLVRGEKVAELIGLYSPVRRGLQTSIGLAMSQVLAEKYKVLYLNFEAYTGLEQLEADRPEADLESLIYYIGEDRNRFILRMKSMIRRMGNWEYIATMRNGVNLPAISGEDWIKLINCCSMLGQYDYIVLDLNESLQDLPEILRLCRYIYTVTKEDKVSCRKLQKYRFVLEQSGYEDVLEKSVRLEFKKRYTLPENPEEYGRGELAEYVRKLIKDWESRE